MWLNVVQLCLAMVAFTHCCRWLVIHLQVPEIVRWRRLMFFEQAREQAEKDYSTNHQDTHVRAFEPHLRLLMKPSVAGDSYRRQTVCSQTAEVLCFF